MKNAAVLVFPDVEELDFVGPWEMLTRWREVANGPAEVALLAASLAPVRCSKGLSVNPSLAMVDAPQLDLLVVPGGKGTRSLQHDGQVLDFIQRQHAGGAPARLHREQVQLQQRRRALPDLRWLGL